MTGAGLVAALPSPETSVWWLGPLPVRAYAVCILLGIAAAIWITVRRMLARGGTGEEIYDVAVWAIVLGIIGGRLYHVISSPWPYFGEDGNLADIVKVWEGGLGIWGAVALGAVGAWIACRRYGFRLSAYADVVAPAVLLAQAIGRLGNYFNQELFGGPTDLPWGLQVTATHPNFPSEYMAGTLFHPTFLYEMVWNLLGVALLLLIDRRLQLRRGMMLWSYVAWYTAGRVWIERLRIDDAEMVTILGITERLNVWTSLLLFLIAVAFLAWLWATRPRTPEGRAEADSVWLPGREPEVALDQAEAQEVDTAPRTDEDEQQVTPRNTQSQE